MNFYVLDACGEHILARGVRRPTINIYIKTPVGLIETEAFNYCFKSEEK
jgi:hypothetical protein